MSAEKLFAPRNVGVCGSSKELSSEAASFCQALGRRLARESLATIVSGGTKRHDQTAEENDLGADWLIVDAARTALDPTAVLERIVTVLRDDFSARTGFRTGTERRSKGKTGEARRISFGPRG